MGGMETAVGEIGMGVAEGMRAREAGLAREGRGAVVVVAQEPISWVMWATGSVTALSGVKKCRLR